MGVFVYVVLKTGGVLEGVGDSCQLHQVRSMMKAPMKAVPLARYRCSLKNSLEICGTQAACASAFVFRERVTVEFGLCCFVSVQRWYFQTSKELS